KIRSHTEKRCEGARSEFAVEMVALPIMAPFGTRKQPFGHLGPERDMLVVDVLRLEECFDYERAHQALQHEQCGIGILSPYRRDDERLGFIARQMRPQFSAPRRERKHPLERCIAAVIAF